MHSDNLRAWGRGQPKVEPVHEQGVPVKDGAYSFGRPQRAICYEASGVACVCLER